MMKLMMLNNWHLKQQPYEGGSNLDPSNKKRKGCSEGQLSYALSVFKEIDYDQI